MCRSDLTVYQRNGIVQKEVLLVAYKDEGL